MRIVPFIVIALAAAAIGAVLGGAIRGSNGSDPAAGLQQQKDSLSQELRVAEDELRAREEELEETRLELARLESQIGDLERQASRAASLAETVEELESIASEPAEEPQATLEDDERDRDDRGRDWWRRGDDGEELTPEEQEARRAEWDARRQEFATRMRENVSNFYSSKLETAGDTASQQRILAMEDYSNYMMDLFQQMRATEDDDERDRLRGEMDTARETMRTLVTDQQDQMLRDLASDVGVTSGTRQDEFVTRMRETMEDPFFQSEGMLGGGRRGGWRGGGWGGGGPGGGDQGQAQSQ